MKDKIYLSAISRKKVATAFRQNKARYTELSFLKNLIFLSCLFIIAPNTLAAYQTHEQIKQAASDYLQQKIPDNYEIVSLKARKIDPRLKFKSCHEPLEAGSTSTFKVQRHYTIAVSCEKPQWKIYVSIKAELNAPVVVATSSILRGDIIDASMLSIDYKSVTGSMRGSFSDMNELIGKQAKRNISRDQILKTYQIQSPILVKRRQKVVIMAKTAALQVKMDGIALKNGKKNELIKVRNSRSDKVVEGVVIGNGLVQVNF